MAYKYESKQRIESKDCEGVVFTIRHLTEGPRIKLSLELADQYDAVAKLRRESAEVAERIRPLLDEAKAAQERDDNAAIQEINRRPDVIAAANFQQKIASIENNQIMPVYVRALLVAVEGLEIDGQDATPELTITDGPPELYREIVEAVRKELGMSEEEQGN
jgi:hypothetical protein